MISVKFYTYDNRFVDAYTSSKLTIRYSLNSINTFDFDIESSDLRSASLDRLQRLRVVVERTDEPSLHGLVDSIQISTDGNFRFRCNSKMYELTQIRAKSNALYQDQQVVAILLDLLSYAPGWRLGNIVTMQDVAVKTTIDLRGERRLFSQIVTLVNSVPNLFFREGSDSTIDFGLFNLNTHPFIPTESIEELTVETKYGELLRQIEAYGGEIVFETETEDGEGNTTIDRTTRTITLNDTVAYNPSLANHPAFPVVMDKGVRVVRNIRDPMVSTTGDRVEFFTNIKPEAQNPTDTEIGQAGYALWLRCVKELEDYSSYEERWECSTTFLPPEFRLGNRVFIHANFNRIFHDYLSGTIGLVEMGITADWFRIVEYEQTIDDKGISYNLTMAKNLKLLKTDPLLELYEMAASPVNPELTQNPLALRRYALLSTVIPAGLQPDCYNTDADGFYDGRTATIPLGSVPSGTTTVTVYGTPFSNREGVQVRMLNSPTPTVPASVCVSYLRNWLPSYTLPVYMLVEFS